MSEDRVKAEGTKAATEKPPGVVREVLISLELLLLSFWLGSMLFFSFAVAPSAFAALPSRHLAGLIVASTLKKVEFIGLAAGAALLLMQLARWKSHRGGSRAKTARLMLLVVMAAAAGLSRFWVSPAMNSIRESMGGGIDDLPLTDPTRVHFNDLHQYSVSLMATAILAGIVVLFLTVRSWRAR
ncbi:MAG TPA: DUF4149 domain-containing protein [Blastocatellia bacterium]|nr:DUF4149 domain-containing protein [Blastocatellia bacterium]